MTLVERLKCLRAAVTQNLWDGCRYNAEAAELRDAIDEDLLFVEAATATLSPVPGDIRPSDQTKN